MKIITRESLIEERIKNGYSTSAAVFRGGADVNANSATPDVIFEQRVKMESPVYAGSHEEYNNFRDIKALQDLAKKDPNRRVVSGPTNAAQEPAKTALEELVSKIIVDITRRYQEAGDLTSVIAREETNLAYARDVNLRDILPYRGKFGVISGTNDSVNLIEQALGNMRTVTHEINAIGWKTSLGNILFNSLHEIGKVNQAAADAFVDLRNSKTIGKIVGATFVASQQQAADATSGSSFDYKVYATIRKAIKKLRTLKDPLTNRPIAIPGIAILCNSQNTWDIERAIRGQLMSAGGGATIDTTNLGALPIAQIIEYDRGITDGFTWGKETLSFPGVTAGKCYVMVPRTYGWVLNKRGLTLETGAGSVLQLSQEERAWYNCQTVYDSLLLGSSEAGATVGAGFGAIIEVTLPTDS
jgi:hypothetical protein